MKPRKRKMPAKTKAKSKPEAPKLMNLKVTRKDRALLTAMAKRYANGNLSAWLRLAGSEFRPSKAQLARLAA
jgi:hypothetical protein